MAKPSSLGLTGVAYTRNQITGEVQARGFQSSDTPEDVGKACLEIGMDPESVNAMLNGSTITTFDATTKAAEVEGALPIPDEPMDLNAAAAEALYNEAQRRFSLFGNARHFGATLPVLQRISRYSADGSPAKEGS